MLNRSFSPADMLELAGKNPDVIFALPTTPEGVVGDIQIVFSSACKNFESTFARWGYEVPSGPSNNPNPVVASGGGHGSPMPKESLNEVVFRDSNHDVKTYVGPLLSPIEAKMFEGLK